MPLGLLIVIVVLALFNGAMWMYLYLDSRR